MNATTERPRRQAKPLQPVNVRAVFVGGATRDDVIAGQAVLSIVTGDDSDRDEKPYWIKALFDGERCVGFSLTTFGTGEGHILSRDLRSCTCGDALYRPNRPGGCRHQAALRQALPTVTVAGPVARKPDRKTERDEVTMAEQGQ